MDPLSDEGLIPDNFDPTVNFNNVAFSFPSRPEVQVSAWVKGECVVGER